MKSRIQPNEVNQLATWAGIELRQPKQDRDEYIIGRALASVEGLIATIAKRYARDYASQNDCMQEGRIATLSAFLSYDKSQGCFSSFVYPKIRKAVQSALGLTGCKEAKTYREKAQKGMVSLDAQKDSQSEDKGLSLYEKLADPNGGESYQVARLSARWFMGVCAVFESRLTKEQSKQVFKRVVVGGENGDILAQETGKTRQAISALACKLESQFIQFAQKRAK